MKPTNKTHQNPNILKNLRLLKSLVSQGQSITLCDLHYLLADKRISPNIIKLFLAEIHSDKLSQLNGNWNQSLKEQQIVTQAQNLKRRVVQQAWRQREADSKCQQKNQAQIGKYLQQCRNKQQKGMRMKLLKNELDLLANKIDISKKDQQGLELAKKYNTLKKQYIFWSNHKRKVIQLKRQKQIKEQPLIKNEEELQILYEKMQEMLRESQRKQIIQKLQHVSPNSTSSQDILKKLQQIFTQYALTQGSASILFQSKPHLHKSISLQKYLKLCSEGGLDTLLSLDQRVRIFKQTSTNCRNASFLQFTNILRKMCELQCEKMQIGFSARQMDGFLQGFVRKHRRQNGRKNMRSLQGYQFKIKGHSGKTKEDIIDELKSRKQMKMIIKQQSKAKKNQESNLIKKMKEKSNARRLYTDQHQLRIDNFNTIDSGLYPMASVSGRKQTYVSIFKKKRHRETSNFSRQSNDITEDRDDRYSKKNMPSSLPQLKEDKIAIRRIIKRNYEAQNLSELIEQGQDDPFLASHINHNKLPSGNSYFNNNRMAKIHF